LQFVASIPNEPSDKVSPMADEAKKVEAALTAMGAGMGIRDRFSDPNRPDWESYKKANQDKLLGQTNDQDAAMEEYRKQLDKERDNKLARGKDRKNKKKKSKHDSDSDSDSSDDSSEDERRRRKRRKKHKKKHKRRRESESSDSEDSDRSRDRKRKKKHKKKKDRSDGEDKNKEHYRLSNFFNNDE
jgi:hypothetical protein